MSDFRIEGLFDFNRVTIEIFPVSQKGRDWVDKHVSPFCCSFNMSKTAGIDKYEALKGEGYEFEEV